MSTFALYRLPHADHCFRVEQTEGEPLRLQSCADLNGRQGFVVAPFHVTDAEPILLIRPDKVERLEVKAPALTGRPESPEILENPESPESPETQVYPEPSSAVTPAYARCFAQIQAQLREGTFRKVVLARSASLPNSQKAMPEEMFWRACERYPRMFISLVSMPDGSYWLTATPEILLEGQGSDWRTIALAGTMQLDGDELKGEGENIRWSPKNIQEQRYVASYIANCLERFSLVYREEGPRTVRAAHLVHLRSDFTFSLLEYTRVGDLLQALHPTPAVCGLPKQATSDFILQYEQADRQYYSGFMGPLNLSPNTQKNASVEAGRIQQNEKETHLYVSLRCMHITPADYRLYAGGGILKDSQLEQEWQETEAKMKTMKNLLVS